MRITSRLSLLGAATLSVLGAGCASSSEASAEQAALQPSDTLVQSITACESAYQRVLSTGALAAWQQMAAKEQRIECFARANDSSLPSLPNAGDADELQARFEIFRQQGVTRCESDAAHLSQASEAYFAARIDCINTLEQTLTRSILDSLADSTPIVMPSIEGRAH